MAPTVHQCHDDSPNTPTVSLINSWDPNTGREPAASKSRDCIHRDAYMRATCEDPPKKKREPTVKSHPVTRLRGNMVINSQPAVFVKSKIIGLTKLWSWNRNQRRKRASSARGVGGRNGPEASNIGHYIHRVADFSWGDRLINNLARQPLVRQERIASYAPLPYKVCPQEYP